MIYRIYPDYPALCRAVSDLINAYIRQKHDAIICLASGHTPLGVMDNFREDALAGKIDVNHVTFIGMDEWVGIPSTNPGSCRYQLDEKIFGPLNIPSARIIFFDSLAQDLLSEVNKVNNFLDAHGGLDILLAGIGMNGHIAMNEPGTPFNAKAHVARLSETTRIVGQKYFDSATELDLGLTIGLQHFAEARLPILMANGAKKLDIMRKTLAAPPLTAIPASIVQTLLYAWVMVDEAAARE